MTFLDFSRRTQCCTRGRDQSRHRRRAIGKNRAREAQKLPCYPGFQQNERTFFLYAFGKNKRANISNAEKETYQQLATLYLNATDSIIDKLLEIGELIEVAT